MSDKSGRPLWKFAVAATAIILFEGGVVVGNFFISPLFYWFGVFSFPVLIAYLLAVASIAVLIPVLWLPFILAALNHLLRVKMKMPRWLIVANVVILFLLLVIWPFSLASNAFERLIL